jgi:hypothetical protein
MREQLIRYLLGELDTEERRELRAQLRESPELQRELDQLRNCFATNQEDDAQAPPPGRLAERTANRVSNSDVYELEAMSAGAAPMSAGGDPPSGVLGWSLADLTVAGGVMLAVSMLVFPALRDSRDGTRSNTCKNNLYELYVLVTGFADTHGYFPQVRPNERVGVIPAQLVQKRYVEPDRLAILMLCPASPGARELRNSPWQVRIPTPEQLRLMPPDEKNQAVAEFPRCYAFRLPQYIGNEYVDARDVTIRHRFNPIFGDLPGDPRDTMSPQHRGSVIQLMNYDGSLIALNMEAPPAFGNDSDLYHNYLGVVAAGIGPNDIVLAPPNAMPGMLFHER